MRSLEQGKQAFLAEIRGSTGKLVEDSFIVNSLRENANQKIARKSYDYGVVAFRSNLRTSAPSLELVLDKEYPLNDFLIDFLDIVRSMGIESPMLARRHADVEQEAYYYEHMYDYIDEFDSDSNDELTPYQLHILEEEKRIDRERFDRYLKATDEAIVEYIDGEVACDQQLTTGIDFNTFYYTNKKGRRITIRPEGRPVGNLQSTLILEAYLLHLLDNQS